MGVLRCWSCLRDLWTARCLNLAVPTSSPKSLDTLVVVDVSSPSSLASLLHDSESTPLDLTRIPKSLDTCDALVDLTLSNKILVDDVSSPASLHDSESIPLDLTSKIPLAITSEILLKLPAESAVRARCVSKLWSSITTDPYFTSTFKTRSATRPSVLMFYKKRDKLLVFSFPQYNSKNSNEPHQSYSSQHVERYHMKYPENCSFYFSQSVHGLICFRESKTYPVILNPSTRQLLTLPKPEKKWKGNLHVFLGYDPIEGKHKVVCMRRAKDLTECSVLTLGSVEKSWRSVETNDKHLPFVRFPERCINGVLYYHAYIVGSDDDSFIMSFDVRTEKFDMINHPADGFLNLLIPYMGKLAGIELLENNDIALWTLEDAKSHKWSNRHFYTPFFRNWMTFYEIVGSTNTGELICVPLKVLNSYFIIYFDPVKNTSRRVDFKGIADKGFRFTHGLGSRRLGSRRLCGIHVLANHVEILMSL